VQEKSDWEDLSRQTEGGENEFFRQKKKTKKGKEEKETCRMGGSVRGGAKRRGGSKAKDRLIFKKSCTTEREG